MARFEDGLLTVTIEKLAQEIASLNHKVELLQGARLDLINQIEGMKKTERNRASECRAFGCDKSAVEYDIRAEAFAEVLELISSKL